MSLTTCILASSSSGNCVLVHSENTHLLVDAGISVKETERRLDAIGLELSAIKAVCVTHEHDDHTTALGTLQRRHGLQLYANSATIEGMERNPKLQQLEWQVFETGFPFSVGDLTISPFSVPHDAYDPVGFVVQNGNSRIGIATDIGMPTTLVRACLKGCQAVIIEANHDVNMLRNTARPWHLKQRITGRQGHLSNEKAAELTVDIAEPALRHIFLAHLSSECNEPELALRTVRNALQKAGHAHITVALSYPDKVSEVWSAD